MSDVFIAHVEEDAEVTLEIALGLEEAGYTTWCYEVDSIPGPSYLIQTGQAVEQTKAVVVVISPHSVGSRQVTKEVVRAHESGKEFIPVLRGITHIEFQNRQPEWREAVGAAASIGIPLEGVAGILPRIVDGLKALGILPELKAETARIARIRRVLDELRGRGILEKDRELPVPTRKPEPEAIVAEVPPAKTAEEAGGRQKWIRLALIASAIIVLSVAGLIILSRLEEPPPPPEVTATPGMSVTFPDKNLEAAVRTTLGKRVGEEITVLELSQLTGLDASRWGITDLTGIEYCVSLDNLNLRENRVGDISALSFLTELDELNLHQNKVSDISALSSLTNLTRLHLLENEISDVAALSSLTNLTVLGLGGNQISNISALSSLTNLTELHLWGNQISDISALSSLTNLTELHLWGNQISDISALSSLTNLTALHLDGNRIQDVSALSSLTNLTALHLHGNRIQDVSALSPLTNLTVLYMGGNRISNISALSPLTNLTVLCLIGNQISDIHPLVGNSGLADGDTLSLGNNPLSATSLNVYIPQLKQRGVSVLLE